MERDVDRLSQGPPPPRRRARLLARSDEDAPAAADLLRRGYRELEAKEGATWQCMVGHAFREAMNRLPGELVESDAGRRRRVDYAALVEAVAGCFPSEQPERWEASEEATAAVAELVARHRALGDGLRERAEELIGALRRGATLPPDDIRARALVWRRLESTFSGIAHLREEGTPLPSAAEVERAVEDFELLFGALEADPFYEVSAELEALARLDAPTRDDWNRAHALMASAELRAAFFEAATAAWLPVLRGAGAFSAPPDAVEGLLPRWPQSEYLARIATQDPRRVAEVVETIPQTDNVRVSADLLGAALTMPAAESIRVIRRLARWVRSGSADALLDSLWSQVVERLLALGESAEALRLARSLLAVDVVDKRGEEVSFSALSWFAVVPRGLSDWGFQSFLSDQVPRLVEARPLETLELLVGQLRWALRGESELAGGEDVLPFEIERPAIEPHEQNTPFDEVQDTLIVAVRNCAVRVAAAGSSDQARAVVEMLDGHVVVRRIRMHALRELAAPQLADAERAVLLDPGNFADIAVHHEYWLLLGARFGSLDPEAQRAILARIEAGPPPVGDEHDPEARAAYVEHWQRDRLSMIRDGLPPEWAEQLGDLEARRGQAEHPEFLHYTTSFTGPTSPLGDHELASLDDSALIEYLVRWEESGDPRAPSREGLGRVLSRAATADPARFSRLAPSFSGVADRYAADLLLGLNEARDNEREIEWARVLGFAAEHVGGASTRWSRQTLAWLLSTGLRRRLIPIELREQVWSLVEQLARDSDPTPEREGDRDANARERSWVMLMLNSVRPVAIGAACDYAAWVLIDASVEPRTLDTVPEARAVLERALDPKHEPSLAVAAALGERWPQLFALDRDWAVAQRERLFGTGTPDRGAAAFDAYVGRSRVYTDVVGLLRDEYRAALDRLVADDGVDASGRRSLIDHIMTMYWHGLDDPDDPLVDSFFARAPAEHRAQAIRQAAHGLRHTPAAEQPVDLIEAFWEKRLSRLSPDDPEAVELCAWFEAAALDPSRALDLLLRTMDVTGGDVSNLPGVLDRAAGLAREEPEQVLDLVGRVIHREARRLWGLRDELRALLRALIAVGGRTGDGAVALIHERGDRGMHFARDLLPGSNPD